MTDGAAVGGPARSLPWPAGALAAGGALLAAALLTVAFVAGTTGVPVGAGVGSGTASYGVSARAQADIPPVYLRFYTAAADRYGLDWAVLAGIGKVECDHGRDPDPSCDREGAVNAAGAGGPMQFLAGTWARYGTDGDGDGRIDRWDAADAIYGAANYLRASGAPGDYTRAIFAYNHASWYVAEVERWADLYRGEGSGGAGSTGTGSGATAGEDGAGSRSLAESPGEGEDGELPGETIEGATARLSPTNGHVALIPDEAPAVVRAMLIAGNELQELPYGPSGHPDPRGAESEDCSSTVNYVLYRSGVRPIGEIVKDNPLAQSYPSWGLPGPGRWVTIYSTAEGDDHVFMVIAGLRLDTSHNGTDVGPNRDEDGPRWRILDHIPTWAQWSVRHPPGL